MDLKQLYYEGFVPGPDESSAHFEMRVETTRKLSIDPDPLAKLLSLSPTIFSSLSPSTLLFRSTKKLPLYIGAMTWIIETDEGQQIPLLQLPPKRRIFGLEEAELLLHEKVHILRCAFNEPKFEEFLAYRQNSSLLRSIFGPLLQTPNESHLFLASLLAPLLSSIFAPSYIIMSYIPFSLLLFGSILRLFFRHRKLNRALRQIAKYTDDGEELLLLLTDKEINSLAKGNPDPFHMKGLRWKLLQMVARNPLTVGQFATI